MIKQRKISQVIPFRRDAEGDYGASLNEVSFSVLKSTAGWGLSVYDRNVGEYLCPQGGGNIAWMRTQKKCVAQAEIIWRRVWSMGGL